MGSCLPRLVQAADSMTALCLWKSYFHCLHLLLHEVALASSEPVSLIWCEAAWDGCRFEGPGAVADGPYPRLQILGTQPGALHFLVAHILQRARALALLDPGALKAESKEDTPDFAVPTA